MKLYCFSRSIDHWSMLNQLTWISETLLSLSRWKKLIDPLLLKIYRAVIHRFDLFINANVYCVKIRVVFFLSNFFGRSKKSMSFRSACIVWNKCIDYCDSLQRVVTVSKDKRNSPLSSLPLYPRLVIPVRCASAIVVSNKPNCTSNDIIIPFNNSWK